MTSPVTAQQSKPATASGRAATAQPSITGGWSRSVSRSQMDDSKSVMYSLPATGEITGWLARARPRLIARCKEGETDIYVVLGMALTVEDGETRSVRVRIDSEASQSEDWYESTDNKAVFSPKPIEFARILANAKRLRLEVTPFNASPEVMQFNVAGFGHAAKELEATCHWVAPEPPPPAVVPLALQPGRPDYALSPNRDEEVYVSDGSTIYHRHDCVSLAGKPNVHGVKLGTLGKDFDPCSFCRPPK